jgi:glycine dehydrogenase subunit 1
VPFIPHTETDVQEMLGAIGVPRLNDLFDEIPSSLRSRGLNAIPPALSEMAVNRLMGERAESDGRWLSFLGAGAYEHHIPAAIWQIATRGEFYSAYTPYQAEASQGTLQLLYEYQSMMAGLMAMEVSNASLYDGASALAEAILMAVRAHKSSRRVLIPATVHPHYRFVAAAIVKNQGITLEEVPYCSVEGITLGAALERHAETPFAALVIPQPNFFGALEAADELTDWAHSHAALAIGVVNPVAAALVRPPGEWGAKGADIAVGEGQPLGVPLSGGGPYFGFMCCRQEWIRQMPGRLVGRTVDREGKPGFTLTLQAREQHIRRSKATSNICTNQGLAVTAATLYMALLGAEGLAGVAAEAKRNTAALTDKLCAIPGVHKAFAAFALYESVFTLDLPAETVLASLRQQGILGGLDLNPYYPELGNAVLVCATETKTAADLDHYAASLARIMAEGHGGAHAN